MKAIATRGTQKPIVCGGRKQEGSGTTRMLRRMAPYDTGTQRPRGDICVMTDALVLGNLYLLQMSSTELRLSFPIGFPRK